MNSTYTVLDMSKKMYNLFSQNRHTEAASCEDFYPSKVGKYHCPGDCGSAMNLPPARSLFSFRISHQKE